MTVPKSLIGEIGQRSQLVQDFEYQGNFFAVGVVESAGGIHIQLILSANQAAGRFVRSRGRFLPVMSVRR